MQIIVILSWENLLNGNDIKVSRKLLRVTTHTINIIIITIVITIVIFANNALKKKYIVFR